MEKKKIEDYLPLYLGAACIGKDGTGRLCSIGILGNDKQRFRKVIGGMSVTEPFDLETDRLLLRPLSDMAEEDVSSWGDVTITHTPYCVELDSKDDFGEFTSVYPDGSILSKSKDDGDIRPINGGELFRLLLSKGFDLFGLIEAGLAIDSTKQQTV